jgi:hypothetical protein
MVDFNPVELAKLRAALLGEPEPDPLVLALMGAYSSTEPEAAGHQASAAERAGAYAQFAQARERLYGAPPDRERVRNSLSPDGASPLVRRIFGG